MLNLHCEHVGTGPDIVLIHGWGWHGGVWDETVSALSPTHRLWIVDLPGHGRSHEIVSSYTVDDLAQAIGKTVPTAATWVGWSLGAQVALAAARGGFSRRLVLIGATPCFLQNTEWDCAWTIEWFERFRGELERDVSAALARFASLHLPGGDSDRGLLRRLRRELSCHGIPDISGLRAGLDVLGGADLRPWLAHISQPARIVHGERDQVVPWQAGEYLGQTLPGAVFSRVTGAGHALPLTHGDVLADIIKEHSGG